DRGLLDLDGKVAKYWPEFAQNGKEGILVRHLLSHTSGLAGVEELIPSRAWDDWDKITSLLAAQKPWWEPGTKSGYHSSTHGHLLGELVRRVTGKTIGTFFKEEIAIPLDIDFHIGLAKEHVPRVAPLIRDKPIIDYNMLILGEIFRLANTSEIIKNEIEYQEKKIQLDYGEKDQFTITISKGKIEFRKGKFDIPDLIFDVSRNRAEALNLIFNGLCENEDYGAENLKISGDSNDVNYARKLLAMVAKETRRLGAVGMKLALEPVESRERSGEREWQLAEIPAANGHGNARSVAKIASIIACEGELNDVRLLSQETLEKILEEQIYDRDLVLQVPIRWGLGVALPTKQRPRPNPRTCYWGGWGGSGILMDLDAKLGIGYVMNQMRSQTADETAKNLYHSDTRGNRLITAVYESLDMI
ncbi:MAG: serine hydrolase, partial [Candidatus Kariarchaeaceae archaeon]